MALSLPIHDLTMDKPAASEVFEHDNMTFYNWLLTETERAHIASMLNIEGKSQSFLNHREQWRLIYFALTVGELKLRGANFLQDRSECAGCGKYSGMDDFVHNALFSGIHSADFMKDVLLGKTEQATPYTEHEVTCSRCNTKHKESKSWLAYPPWPTF